MKRLINILMQLILTTAISTSAYADDHTDAYYAYGDSQDFCEDLANIITAVCFGCAAFLLFENSGRSENEKKCF